MDAVTLLRNDHKTVERLFKQFEKAGPNAHKTKKDLVEKIVEELAQAMEKAKKVAPTHPHPRAPDTPPGNLVAGAAAGAIDKAQDTGKGAVRKILGRRKAS